jgi:hypothetical protein
MDKSLDLMIRMGENVINENFLRDFSPHTKNKAKLVSINETNAKRMLDRHTAGGYVIISPCRGYAEFGLTPGVDKEALAKINNERVKELYQEILNSGFSFTPCYGGFIENLGSEDEENVYEKSFIIYPQKRDGKDVDFEALRAFAIEMGRKFNQDSVLITEPGKNPKYITQSGDVDMEFENEPTFNDLTSEYFTDLHKNTHKSGLNGKPTRFSFNEVYINPAPQGLSEANVRKSRGEVFIPYLKG